MNQTGRDAIANIGSVLLMLTSISLFGCSRNPFAPPNSSLLAGSIGTASWINFERVNPEAQLDEAYAAYVVFPPKRIACTVLMDFVGGFKGTDGELSDDGTVLFLGAHEAKDGRKVEWQWKTTDGKIGTMTINGAPYDLETGALFLISTRGGEVRVRQLQRDLPDLQANSAKLSLESLLKEDADAARFFAESSPLN